MLEATTEASASALANQTVCGENRSAQHIQTGREKKKEEVPVIRRQRQIYPLHPLNPTPPPSPSLQPSGCPLGRLDEAIQSQGLMTDNRDHVHGIEIEN